MSGHYTLMDYTETLAASKIERETIKSVLAAWGESPEIYNEWSGGFLLELNNGTFAYASGWCDTTGWGCQDGGEVEYFDTQPELSALREGDWDIRPHDLNYWHETGAEWNEQPV